MKFPIGLRPQIWPKLPKVKPAEGLSIEKMQEIAELRLQEEIALIALKRWTFSQFSYYFNWIWFFPNQIIMSFESKEHARSAFLEPGATKALVALQVETWTGSTKNQQ